MSAVAQAVQMESAARGFTYGQRVRVAPGRYRVGRSPNFSIDLPQGATGTVRVSSPATQLHAAVVLVDLDEACLPNPFAPGTAMVPPAQLGGLT